MSVLSYTTGVTTLMTEIERLRNDLGWSRPEMFRQLGVPVRTQENWDAGKRLPPEWVERLLVAELNRRLKLKEQG